MPGTLFVVATPIGNLEDITLRALRVLREVDLIAAEDTRRTARAAQPLRHLDPIGQLSQHNTRTRLPQLLARLEAGKSVALVTDAGTPGVSDPGVELVEACIEAQIRGRSDPGASAPLTAAVASGFPLIPLTILGFPQRRSKDRMLGFREFWRLHTPSLSSRAPIGSRRRCPRLRDYLGERPIMVGRELTKRHQEFFAGTAAVVLDRISEPKRRVHGRGWACKHD